MEFGPTISKMSTFKNTGFQYFDIFTHNISRIVNSKAY